MNFLGLESAQTGKQQLSEEVLHVLAKLDCQSVKTAADYVCSKMPNGLSENLPLDVMKGNLNIVDNNIDAGPH